MGGRARTWLVRRSRRAWAAGSLYGTDLSLLARLRLDYSDGTTQWVDTNDSTWSARVGPRTAADLIDGESYDARLYQRGWLLATYDDSGWNRALLRSTDKSKVVPQPDEPVRTTELLQPKRRIHPTTGTVIFDLGQNMVGVARMTFTGKAGATARIRYGEELNPDDTLYTANLRSAKATDTYTFDSDGTVTFEPAFTSHGFRYVEITGVEDRRRRDGVVYGSDLTTTGGLETSSPMLNQLLSNISWGQRGNFLSIPTDTPARDERLGWTGDISVFAPTANYLRDTRAFLGKWMIDLRDTQQADGDFLSVAPCRRARIKPGSTGWSDAGITVPYSLWQTYGDASVIREFYAAMKRYLSLLQSHGRRIDPVRRDSTCTVALELRRLAEPRRPDGQGPAGHGLLRQRRTDDLRDGGRDRQDRRCAGL